MADEIKLSRVVTTPPPVVVLGLIKIKKNKNRYVPNGFKETCPLS